MSNAIPSPVEMDDGQVVRLNNSEMVIKQRTSDATIENGQEIKPNRQLWIKVPFLDPRDVLNWCQNTQMHFNLPLAFWDSALWKSIGDGLEETFNMTINSEVVQSGIIKSFADLIEGFSGLKERIVSLRYNLAKKVDGQLVLAISVQYMEAFDLRTKVIGITGLSSPSRPSIEDRVQSMLSRLGLTERHIFAVVAMKGTGKPSLPIFPTRHLNWHDEIINPLVNSSFARWGGISEISKELKNAAMRIEAHIRNEGYQDVRAPTEIQAEAHWTDVVEKCLEMAVFARDDRFAAVKNIDWGTLVNVARLLQPVRRMWQKIEANKFHLIGDLFLYFEYCRLEIQMLKKETDHGAQDALVDHLSAAKVYILNRTNIVSSIYLDPRINCKGSLMLSRKTKDMALVGGDCCLA